MDWRWLYLIVPSLVIILFGLRAFHRRKTHDSATPDPPPGSDVTPASSIPVSATPERESTKTHARKALIVGIGQYEHNDQFGNLETKDAAAFAERLGKDYGFDVTALIGCVDSSTLSTKRATFLSGLSNTELVVIALFGHGIEQEPSQFLVPSDARIGQLPDDFFKKCLDIHELVKLTQRHAPKAQRIFIFDCCRSKISEEARENVDYRGVKEPRRTDRDLWIFSTQVEAPAYAEHTLLRALKEGLTDRESTLLSVVDRAFAKVRQAGLQDPIIKHTGSSFMNWRLASNYSPYLAVHRNANPTEYAGNLTALAVDPTGRYVAVAIRRNPDQGLHNNTVEIFDAAIFQKVTSFEHVQVIYSLDFSPSGQDLIFGDRAGAVGRCSFLETPQKQKPFVQQCFRHPVNHIEWCKRSNRILAASTDRTAKVLESGQLRELARAIAHESDVWSATLHPGGRYAVTGSRDRTCVLWDMNETEDAHDYVQLKNLGVRIKVGAPVRTVRFDSSGTLLAVGTQDGRLHLYDFVEADRRFIRRQCIHMQRRSLGPEADKTKFDPILVDSLNKQREKNGRPSLAADDLDSNLWILSADFSPDSSVIAYGANIDAFGLHSLDANYIRVGGMEDYIANKHMWRYRCQEVRFCATRRRLYAACGSKLHCLLY